MSMQGFGEVYGEDGTSRSEGYDAATLFNENA